MIYTESLEKALDTCKTALGLMERHQIPANPQNYEVWYSYAAGSHPELSKSIDVALADGFKFDAESSKELYERYLAPGSDAQAVTATSSEIEQKIGDVLGAINAACSDNSDYGATLVELSQSLTGDPASADVTGVVRSILKETQQAITKSKRLEQRLQESGREISSLRESLVEVQQEALTDALTQIANRKCFDQTLREAAADASEAGTPLSLLLGDIDHFKAFNDTFGHHIGDSVLKVVARNLKDNVKGADLPARYGGEEFAVILPNTTMENATKLANQIREAISKKKLKSAKSGESYGKVTLSIGVAAYRPGEPLADLVQRADKGLYRAKETGRNRVVNEAGLDGEPVSLTG